MSALVFNYAAIVYTTNEIVKISCRMLFSLFVIIFSMVDAQNVSTNEKDALEQLRRNPPRKEQEFRKFLEQTSTKNFKRAELLGTISFQEFYLRSNNYTAAFKQNLAAEKIALQLKDFQSLANIAKERGKMNVVLGGMTSAKEDLKKSVFYANQVKDYNSKQLLLSAAYANMAGMYEGKVQPDSVLINLKKSLWAVEALKDKKLNAEDQAQFIKLLTYGNLNIGSYFVHLQKPQDLQAAEPYFAFALSALKNSNSNDAALSLDVLHALGRFCLQKKDYQKSIHYLEQALIVNKEISNDKTRLYIYEELQENYAALKNMPQENKYLKLIAALSDSISSNEKKSIVENTELQLSKK